MYPAVEHSFSREPRIPPISGFWRRIWAFAVDSILLVIVVLGYTVLLGNWLVTIGLWTHLFDLSITFLYFGLLNSRLSGGQTVGKRWFRIQVVGAGGTPVTVARSFVRAIPLTMLVQSRSPLQIDRMTGYSAIDLTWFTGSPYVVAFVSFLAFSLHLGVVWIYIFNGKTRQSLHDLVAGTYVVSCDTPGHAVIAPVSRIAVGLYSVLLLLGLARITLGWTSLRQAVLSYSRIEGALRQADGFVHLSKFGRSGETLEVAVLWIPERISDTAQGEVARQVMLAYPGMQEIKDLKVTIGAGFGRVARGRLGQSRSQSVEAWRKELGLDSRSLQ